MKSLGITALFWRFRPHAQSQNEQAARNPDWARLRAIAPSESPNVEVAPHPISSFSVKRLFHRG